MSESYDTGPPPAAAQSSDGGIRLNPGFIRTPPGLLLLINLVLLFLSWCIMAGWRGEVHWTVENDFEGGSGFYLTTTLVPWFILLIVFVLMLFNIHKKIPINFPITVRFSSFLLSRQRDRERKRLGIRLQSTSRILHISSFFERKLLLCYLLNTIKYFHLERVYRLPGYNLSLIGPSLNFWILRLLNLIVKTQPFQPF